jgi:hypothetical protein
MRRLRTGLLVTLALAVPVLGGQPSATPAAAASGVALLVSVQADDFGTFDRVTFTFEGGIPEILEFQYFSGPAVENPSGEPVSPPVGGGSKILLTLSNASGVDLSVSPFVVTYTGPKRLFPELPSVVEVVQVQDFESTLQWVIAVRGPAIRSSVRIELDPTRVVVDVPHGTVPTFTG